MYGQVHTLGRLFIRGQWFPSVSSDIKPCGYKLLLSILRNGGCTSWLVQSTVIDKTPNEPKLAALRADCELCLPYVGGISWEVRQCPVHTS